MWSLNTRERRYPSTLQLWTLLEAALLPILFAFISHSLHSPFPPMSPPTPLITGFRLAGSSWQHSPGLRHRILVMTRLTPRKSASLSQPCPSGKSRGVRGQQQWQGGLQQDRVACGKEDRYASACSTILPDLLLNRRSLVFRHVNNLFIFIYFRFNGTIRVE